MKAIKELSILLVKFLIVLLCVVVIILCAIFWLYSGKTSELKWRVLSSLHLPVGRVGDTYIDASLAHKYSQLASLLGKDAPSLGSMLALEAVARNRVHINRQAMEAAEREFNSNLLYQKISKAYGKEFPLNTLGRQYALSSRLGAWYAGQDSLETEPHAKAKKAYAALRSGSSWAAVASDMSEDAATKWFDGDTGYVDLSQAVPEYAEVVNKLPINVLSVVYSRYGVHIVEVSERVEHNGVELTKLQEVLFKTSGFDAWLSKEMRGQMFSWYLQ